MRPFPHSEVVSLGGKVLLKGPPLPRRTLAAALARQALVGPLRRDDGALARAKRNLAASGGMTTTGGLPTLARAKARALAASGG